MKETGDDRNMNEIRREPLLGRWVAVLSESMKPEDYLSSMEPSAGGHCDLCGEESGGAEEIYSVRDESGKWLVRVLPAMVPVFSPEGDLGRKGIGIYDRMNAIGVNEMLIESPQHNVQPEDMGPDQMLRVVEAFSARMTELEKDVRVRHIMIHKNCGIPSGDACGHPHSLITATPVIPKRVKEELDGAKQYYEYKERCIFCDIMREEERLKERVVMETPYFLVFCPYAARFPFEFWILPRIHNCSFRDVTEEEKRDLSETLSIMFKKLRRLLKNPPYNYVLHTAPSRIPRRNHWHTLGEDFHWHIEVMPRIKSIGSFELGSGMYTLTTSPEDAAKYLKEVSHGD
ncbi:MAG: galactose-1-phosphate uridylyltransferase [Nitrospirae bacterium]|nr:galactose-1-phosphate uridylyltransferase [Nitrospirota bacterium]